MKQRLLILVPLGLLAGLIAWRLIVNKNDKTAQVEASSARKKAAATVRVAIAARRDIVHTFQGIGEVEAPADVRIAPKVTGRLDYLEVREGAPVTKGQVLARIDPSQAQAAVNQQQAAVESAHANLVNAEIRYNRYYSLYKQGFTAAQDIDDNRTQVNVQRSAYKAAQAQLRIAQSQLADTTLRSPINGFVASRFLDPGSIVTAGQPVISVQAIRNVYVTTSVPEDIHATIHPGMEARVVFDAIPGRTFTGKVRQVSPSADPQTRQFLVRAAFNNEQNVIRPGMFCRMTLITQVTHNAIVVPREAIKQGKNGPGQVVTVIDDTMKAHQRPVRTGDQDTNGIAITEGVQAGEKVVILSGQPVREGQVVKIDTSGDSLSSRGQPTVNMEDGGAPIKAAGDQQSTGGPNAPAYGGNGGNGSGGSSAGMGSTFGTSGNGAKTGQGNSSSNASGVTIIPQNRSNGSGTSSNPVGVGSPGSNFTGGASSGGFGNGTGNQIPAGMSNRNGVGSNPGSIGPGGR